jgi:hypothetical protein
MSGTRHDLERIIFAYLDAADVREAPKDTPIAVGVFNERSPQVVPGSYGLPEHEKNEPFRS